MAKQSKEFFLFSFPAIAILLLIAIYPIIKAVILSLQNVDLRMPWTREFVGFANYIRLLSDHRFLNSLKVSLIYSTATLSLSILIGLALAFFVQEYFKGRLKNIILFLFLLSFVIIGF